VDANDSEQSVLSFLRKGRAAGDVLLAVFNFTPVPRYNYRVGVSQGGRWEEVLNSDAPLYGGSGQGNMGGVQTAPFSWHGRRYLLNVTVPPLGMVVFKPAPAPANGHHEAGPSTAPPSMGGLHGEAS
jgi:1,4-alpha-glucan branching enzyme